MKTKYKFIYFEIDKFFASDDPKELVWYCRNLKRANALGYVEWYAPWKQFVFTAYEDAIFSAGCLKDIVDFTEQLNEANRP